MAQPGGFAASRPIDSAAGRRPLTQGACVALFLPCFEHRGANRLPSSRVRGAGYARPVTEAIFGLVGVLIGGFLQGGVGWIMERRKENWAARKAARLVTRDLHRARLVMNMIHDDGANWGILEMEFGAALERWPQYADVLAGTIHSNEQWGAITSGIEVLERLHQRATVSPEEEIDDEMREFIGDISERVWIAMFNASLIGVAGAHRSPKAWLKRQTDWWFGRSVSIEEEAREVVRRSYEAEGRETPPDALRWDDYDVPPPEAFARSADHGGLRGDLTVEQLRDIIGPRVAKAASEIYVSLGHESKGLFVAIMKRIYPQAERYVWLAFGELTETRAEGLRDGVEEGREAIAAAAPSPEVSEAIEKEIDGGALLDLVERILRAIAERDFSDETLNEEHLSDQTAPATSDDETANPAS
jgi:hypothetical protein